MLEFSSRPAFSGNFVKTLVASLALLFVSSAAVAMPTVNGTTISWPDDGAWYQVQDAITYQSICNGGTSCEVNPGTYVVINHSSGERFDNIEVGLGSSNTGTPFNLTNGTFTWPDDSWYQVQRSDTYESVCNGNAACTVTAGNYIVINHSTGTRFDNVEVGEANGMVEPNMPALASGDPRTSSWSIEGNTIVFHTDGWYQVQDDFTYHSSFETICNGQSSCEVDTGAYQIINHTTGDIWQGVVVGVNNVTWSQSQLFSANLSWSSVVYNSERFGLFNIYMNGELVSTTAANDAVITDFTRGTYYDITIYAVLDDGSEELIGERTVLTSGPSMAVVPYGQPAQDTGTFGFEVWDSIADANKVLYPSDCLFSMPTGAFCFSPATRYLIGNRYQSAFLPQWEFQLPGDNSTNNIEAIIHYYGTGGRRSPAIQFALVADITTSFAQSSYEISVFNGRGTFAGTYPILQDIRYSSNAGVERQINLDGADLRVTRGPDRPYPYNNFFSLSQPRYLHIVGEYYEPVSNGNPADLTGWSRAGAFLAVVDADTGDTISQTFYPGETMNTIND